MVADVQIAMKIDPTVDVAPTFEFNDAAQAMVIDNPQAQMANNVNTASIDPGFSASMSFQAAAGPHQETFIPEHGPQTVEVDPNAGFGQELIQGCENATYALQNMQLSGGSWLTDCMNVAMTAMDNVAGVKQDVEPVQVAHVVSEPDPKPVIPYYSYDMTGPG